MSTRKSSAAVTNTLCAVEVAVLSPLGGELAVLLERGAGVGSRRGWRLPQLAWRKGETLGAAGQRIATAALGTPPAWIEQLATLAPLRQETAAAALVVTYLAVAPRGSVLAEGGDREWHSLARLPAALHARQREAVANALAAARDRMDYVPVAFRLLPRTFTLGELQEIHEMLIARKLHKASFRRALSAARLVEPVGERRSEGRGRPAQLYRYAPRKRRSSRRAVRFDRLV